MFRTNIFNTNNNNDPNQPPANPGHNVLPYNTGQSLFPAMQQQSCLEYCYNYMLVPIFLYNAYYLWPQLDPKNADLYHWIRVTCWFTLFDKLGIGLLLGIIVFMCCFNLAGTNVQVRLLGMMAGLMAIQSIGYFFLSMWGIVESFKMKPTRLFDVYLAFFIMIWQTAQAGAVGMLFFLLISAFTIMGVGIQCGCIDRPEWLNQARNAFTRASGINLNKLTADELTKLEAHCGKVIDENYRKWFQEQEVICSICYDEYKTNQKLIILPECKHIYHKDDIVQWLAIGNNLCPLCKSDVKEQIKRLPEKIDLSGKWLNDLLKSSQDHQSPATNQNPPSTNNQNPSSTYNSNPNAPRQTV